MTLPPVAAMPPAPIPSLASLSARDLDPLPLDLPANAFVIVCSALVLIMIPGLGYFYSGLSHHKNALVFLHLCMLSLAIVSVQWFMWGFSLAFSPNGGPFIGNGYYLGLKNIGGTTYPGTVISTDVFVMFQAMFAALTAALPFGSAADRTRILPSMLFILIWTTLVYDFVAYWVWAPNGWLRARGYLDFAGGCPVEVVSGFAGLAFAMYMGPRRTRLADEKPHNLSFMVLGTSLLWFGWLGFNGGSAFNSSARAGMAVLVTNLAASTAGLVWMFWDYIYHGHKYSCVGFCLGAVAGLVAITPAAGFVEPWAGVIVGIVSATLCRTVAEFNKKRGLLDDTLDVFAVHGLGGVIGNLLVGVFATSSIIELDTTGVDGGWLNKNWKQLGVQAYATAVCGAWSFTMTYLIFWIMDRIPGLHFRVKERHEREGLDHAQMGEYAYNYHRTVEADERNGNGPTGGVPLSDIALDAIDKRASGASLDTAEIDVVPPKPVSPHHLRGLRSGNTQSTIIVEEDDGRRRKTASARKVGSGSAV
ncbi:putative ammonium transporter MEP1 [Powellomyces hirtus]|nr:putative ammonium transporter MEP1 [Powellomyces hirtus]